MHVLDKSPYGQSPPQVFVRQVKDALSHLYHFALLEHHPLVREYGLAAIKSGESPGQSLRRALMAAIETLNPGKGVPFRSPRARLYQLLTFHYIESMTVQEAAHELGISRRQAHRDLQQAVESVAAVLWAQRTATLSSQSATQPTSVSTANEIAHLVMNPQEQDICELLRQVRQVVDPLVQKRGGQVIFTIPPHPVIISADPVMARQVLVNTLSYAIGQASSGVVSLMLSIINAQVTISLHYTASTRGEPALSPAISQIAERLGWTIHYGRKQADEHLISVHIPAAYPCILVIDDNEGFLELIDTYLDGYTCRVLKAHTSQQGFQLALEVAPHVIILDVMMPQMDGWELLQRLRNHPKTSMVPIIVCSVINNPELAYALGATIVLPKPITRSELVMALEQVGVL